MSLLLGFNQELLFASPSGFKNEVYDTSEYIRYHVFELRRKM